jgi:hypothetical protein
MALPTLTPEQRAEALKKAAAARTARKELRDAIARGDETIPAVLSRAKTGIDASRRAAGLGDRQRQALLDALK